MIMADTSSTEALDPAIQAQVDVWLLGPYDEKTKDDIRQLLKENPKEVADAFYKSLTFGTGGMRGIMGVGSNRMNDYTVRFATQGLANYLLKEFKDQPVSVFISFDSRHHSHTFAEEAAKVLAGNGIKVFLTRELRPTPLVSFGCRFKKCNAAIMITASHNPPEYNGYKVYWSDGGQVLPPHDGGIIEEVQKIKDLTQVKSVNELTDQHIELVDEEVDEAYLQSIKTLAFYPDENARSGSNLAIVYTSLHGTGITLAPRALRLWGFHSLKFVEKQIVPNGDFPTAPYPNPEIEETLKLGIEALQETGSDILLVNDPDADRVGVVAMHDGKPYRFNGNQMACICCEHICRALSDQNALAPNAAFVKSIVTTELFRAIAERYGAHCFDVLPGFKYIAERIRDWEKSGEYEFLFGAEESYGYLLGTFSRDKDAIVSSALIAEIALQAKLQGRTLVDLLYDLHETYGIYDSQQISIAFEESQEGHQAMQKAMERIRQINFNELEGFRINKVEDYLLGQSKDLKNGTASPLTLPKTDALVYWMDDGSKMMIRPSGTEPKVKVYCAVIQREYDDIETGEAQALNRAHLLLDTIRDWFQTK
jgi:phosphoglucomutase/phosphomannomutase